MDLKKIAESAAHEVSEHIPLAAVGKAVERLGQSAEHKAHEAVDFVTSLFDSPRPGHMPPGRVTQHPQLHAHNDELHDHPLVDALRAGSSSLEVDTQLVDGKLLIGHDLEQAKWWNRSLEDTYFKPLKQRIDRYGAVYTNSDAPPFTLEIEFKGDSTDSYRALKPLLHKYQNLLTRYQDGQIIEGPIHVVLTGHIPRQARRDNPRLLAFDGSARTLLDHPERIDRYQTPRVNGAWSDFFQWDGQGEMSARDMATLRKIVKHSDDRDVLLRFWDAPDTPEAWKLLSQAGVQLINSDHLREFADWDH
ncbi:MAG: hypothetical protein U0931_13175 [Vulcanimicrobiota bacterium]